MKKIADLVGIIQGIDSDQTINNRMATNDINVKFKIDSVSQ